MLLNENEAYTLLESGRETKVGDQIINEAIIADALSAYGQTLSEDSAVDLLSEELLSERNIVKLDKYSKRALAEKKAAIVLAKEANDPAYKKLQTVYKLKHKLIDHIMNKYGAKAKIRVKKNAKQSTIAKVVSEIKEKVHVKGRDLPKKD